MITLFTFLTIFYFIVATTAAMAIGNWCYRKRKWDEMGTTMAVCLIVWFLPLTVAMDMGWVN